MVERRDLITICRQIGTMMEVGVDFLRITRALRDQTENPRLLELYDQLDHSLKMGESLADSISHAPDIFTPFAVNLIRQGEARGDIEAAWHRLADYYKQEAQEDRDLGEPSASFGTGYIPTRGLNSNGLEIVAPKAPVTVGMLSDLIDRVQMAALRGLTWIAAFLLSLAAVFAGVDHGIVDPRWESVVLLLVSALFIGGGGSWLRFSLAADRRRDVRCSFCGKAGSEVSPLQRSPRLAGAAICAACASVIGDRAHTQEPATAPPTLELDPFIDLDPIPTNGKHPPYVSSDDPVEGSLPGASRRYEI